MQPYGAPGPSPYGGFGPPGGPPPGMGPLPAPRPPPKSGTPWVLILGIVGVLCVMVFGVGAIVLIMRARKAKPPVTTAAWSDLDSPVPISSDDPMRGSRTAPITIVVFSDFQCPFCSRLGPTLDSVRTKYGADVRVVWKNDPLPFHTNAKPAAEAARGVFLLGGDAAFWRFHDEAFKNQSSLD